MDQELYKVVRKAQSGDGGAFAELLSRFKNGAFRYAFGMLGDRQEAEDAAQEAFIKAFYALPKLESPYAFSSWFMRIVSNQCCNRLEKRNKNQVLQAELQEAGGSAGTTDQAELRMEIEAAMRKLSPEHREAILLRDVEGYSYEEIASMTGVPLGTVKSRIRAARLNLREEMIRE